MTYISSHFSRCVINFSIQDFVGLFHLLLGPFGFCDPGLLSHGIISIAKKKIEEFVSTIKK